MVRGNPSTKIVQIIWIGLKLRPPGGVVHFFLFQYWGNVFLYEIARPSKRDNTSWLKSLDLEP